MKKMLKRTLSLILAMVMVLGLLPLNAMAAMIMDGPDSGRSETPVIDRSDPIVDTHATSISGGHQRPEVPETAPPVESDEPADQYAIGNVGGTGQAWHTADDIAVGGSGEVTSMQFISTQTVQTGVTVAIIPNFKLSASGRTPSDTVNGAASASLNPGSALSGKGNLTQFKAFNYPFYAVRTVTGGTNFSGATLTMTDTGVLTSTADGFPSTESFGTGTGNTYAEFTARLQEIITGSTKVYDASNTEITDKSSLPFTIFYFFGQDNSYITKPAYFPLEASKLKVEIEPNTTMISWDGYAPGAPATPAANIFATATITNLTNGTLENIRVNFVADTTHDKSTWGNTTVTTHGLVTENNMDMDEEVPTGPQQFRNALGLEEDDGETLNAWENEDDVRAIVIESLGPGESVEVPIYAYNDIDYGNPVLYSFDGTEWNEDYDIGPGGTPTWYNYTVWAAIGPEGAPDEEKASANAGVAAYAEAKDWDAEVRLIDTAGNPVTNEGHTVKLTRNNGTVTKTMNSSADNSTWTSTDQCRGTETWQVVVDGIPTGKYLMYGAESTDVTLYTLTVSVKNSSGQNAGTVQDPVDQTLHYVSGKDVDVSVTVTATGGVVSGWTINGAKDTSKNTTSDTVTIDGSKGNNTVVVNVDQAIPVEVTVYRHGTDSGNRANILPTVVSLSTDPDTLSADAITLTYNNTQKFYEIRANGATSGIAEGSGPYYVFIGDYPAYTTDLSGPCTITTDDPKGSTYVGTVILTAPADEADGTLALADASGATITTSAGMSLPAGTELTLTVTPGDGKGVSKVTDTTQTNTDGSLNFSNAGTESTLTDTLTTDPYSTTITVGANRQTIAATFVDVFYPTVGLIFDDLTGEDYPTSGDGLSVKIKNKSDGTLTELTYNEDYIDGGFTSEDPVVGKPEDYSLVINGFDVPASNTTIYPSLDDAAEADPVKYSLVFTINVQYKVGSANAATSATNASFTGGDYTSASTTGYVPAEATIDLTALKTVSSTPWNSWTVANDADDLTGSVSAGSDTATEKKGTYTTPGVTATGPITITSTYEATDGTAIVHLYLNDAQDVGNTHTVYIWDKNTGDPSDSDSGAISLVQGTNSGTDNRYIYSAGAPGGKYYIWVDGAVVTADAASGDVDATAKNQISVPAGDTATVKVDYYTVTIDAGAGVKANTNKANGTNSDTATVMKGATGVTLAATADTNYDPTVATWVDQLDPADSIGGSDAVSGQVLTRTLNAVTHETHWEVSFAKVQVTVTINMKKNGSAWAESDLPPVLNKSDADQADPITLAYNTDKTAYTATVDAGETYYIWPQVTPADPAVYVTTAITLEFTADEVAAKAASRELNYYELTVVADREVDDAAVVDQDLTTATAAAEDEGPTVYYTGTEVKIAAAPSDATNYAFSEWETSANGTAPASVSAASTTVTLKAETTLTAKFDEKAYTSKLTVKVDSDTDTDNWTSGDVVSATLVDKDGNAITGVTVTRDTQDGKDLNTWTATGVPTNAGGKGPFKWVVTTLSGAYDSTDITSDAAKRNATMDLFTVTVANGAGNDNSHKPTITGKNSSALQRAIGPKGTQFTLAANPMSGYTQKAHSNGWTKSVSTYGAVGSNTQYTINNDTTGTQELTPAFTYEVPIILKHGDDPVDAVKDKISVSGGGTVTKRTGDGNTGRYIVSGLDPEATSDYVLTINGFESSETLSAADAGVSTSAANDKVIPMYAITTTTATVGTDNASNTATVSVAGVYTNVTTAYVPKGAALGASGKPAVTVTATATTGYRLANSAKRSADSDLWTATAVTNDGIAFGNATTTTANSNGVSIASTATNNVLLGDVTITGHFVQQFALTVQKAPSTDSTSTAYVTAVQDTATATLSPTSSTTKATVDGGDWVKVTATPGTGRQLKGWHIASDSTLYSKLDDEGKMVDDNKLTDKITDDDTYTSNFYKAVGNEVYVKVTQADTLTAVFEEKEYDVTITVNLDNVGTEGYQVRLVNSGDNTKYYDLTDNEDGTYSGKVLAGTGTYNIQTDVLKSGTLAATGRTVSVGESPATNAAELNYYTLEITEVASDNGALPAALLTGFTSASSLSADVLTTTVLAAATGTTQVDVLATLNNHSGSTPYYRFKTWGVDTKVSTADNAAAVGSVNAATGIDTYYTLPAITTLKTYTDTVTGKGIALTATYQRQYKVTLTNSDKTSGSITGPTNSGVDSNDKAQNSSTGSWTLYLDAGSYVDVTTVPNSSIRTKGWELVTKKADDSDPEPATFNKKATTNPGAAISADSDGYFVDDTNAASRNGILITPATDVEVKVHWERDAFTGTINLVRSDGTTAYTEGNTKVYIELKDAASSNKDTRVYQNFGDNPDITQTLDGSSNPTGTWTCSELLNNHTYQVWVNGYNTGYTITTDNATTTTVDESKATVKMYEIAVDVTVDGNKDTKGDGTGTDYMPEDTDKGVTINGANDPIKGKLPSGSGSSRVDSFFVPETSSNVVITLTAAAAGTGLRYRTVSDDGAGKTFWSAYETSMGTVSNTAITSAFTNVDTGSATLSVVTKTLNKDVTIYANYISVLVLKVQAKSATSPNVVGGSVKITAGGTVANDKLSTSIDKGKIATVVATPTNPANAREDFAFVDWTIATTDPAGAGKWATSASDDTEDSGDRTDTDFFSPSANTTLEATFKNLTATGDTIQGEDTKQDGVTWNNGVVFTVQAGYTAALTGEVDLTNLATAATKPLTASLSAVTPGLGQTSGEDKITLLTSVVNPDGEDDTKAVGLAAEGGHTTVELSFITGLGIGTYVIDLEVADDDMTVTVPVTVVVEPPEKFKVQIKTFPDGVSDPSSANILSVILVPTAGDTAKSKGNITLTDADNDGVWEGEAWWDGTYRVYVDGYATSTGNNVTNQAVYNGATHVEVDVKDLYTVSFAKDDYKDTDGSTVMGKPYFETVRADVVKDDVSPVTVKPKNDKDEDEGERDAIVVAAGGKITLTHGAQTNETTTGANHYVLDKWQQHVVTATATATDVTVPASNAYTVNTTAPATDEIAPIFVDPIYKQRYKLTLDKPGAAGSKAPANAVGARFGSTGLKSDGTNYTWVDKDVDVVITGLLLDNTADRDNFIFSHWSQDHDDDDAAAGSFTASGTAKNGDITFTPKGDTTLTPNYWLKPTLSGTDYYHLNVPQDDALPNKFNPQGGSAGKFPDGTTTNDLPKFAWTQNDAKLDTDAPFQIWLEDTNGNGEADETEWVTLDTTQVTQDTDDGKVTFTVTLDYLKTLTVGDGQTNKTYDVRVLSHTPDADTDNHPNGEPTVRASKLTIYVTPERLTEVNIQVEDEKSATASIDDEDRDLVKYKDHKHVDIVKDNKLTWTWYVSDPGVTKAQLDGLTHAFGVDGQFTAAQNAQYATNANAAADTLGSVVQAASSNWATASQLDVTNTDYKGRYIYAVVAASQTGYGAVITNAIAVDYDAAIKVTKDASADIDEENYRVFLVPNTLKDDDLTVNATTGALEIKSTVTGKGAIVEATWDSDNLYTTEPSELKGGTGYNVYVNKVEGVFTKYEDTTKDVTGQINADSESVPVVPFFSVNYVPTYVHDATDSAGTNVGEDFGENDEDAVGITAHITGITALTVGDGVGVLTGSSVTVKTVNKDWKQDYNVDWQNATTEPTDTYFASYPNTGVNNLDANVGQTKAEACDTGTVLSSVTKKTWVGAQLDQNVYTVSGNVWVNAAVTSGGVVIAATDPKRPYLSFTNGDTTYVFRADGTGGGKHKSTVTIKGVPKKSEVTGSAITGEYDITAEPLFGSIIKKYIPGQNMSGATDTSIAGVSALGGDNSNTLANGTNITSAPVFTVVVEASKYVLTIPEKTGENNKATHEASSTTAAIQPPTNQAGRIASATWTQSFGYDYASGATTKDYTFTLINEGNTVLDVSLNILKSVKDTTDADNNGYIYGAKATQTGNIATGLTTDSGSGVTSDSFNGTIFEDLKTGFTLQPKDSKDADNNPTDRVSFTVKVPEGLDVSKVATYAFQFTSIEHGTDATGATLVYGPAVTYQLTQTINPLAITKIDVDTDTANTYKPKDLTIGGMTGNAIPTGALAEVEYVWYVAKKGETVNFSDSDTGSLSGGATFREVTTAGVDTDTSVYTLQSADQGMSLYLLARNTGDGNVVKAAYVKVGDLPFDLKIVVKENGDNTATEGNYAVRLYPEKSDGSVDTSTYITAEPGDDTTDGFFTAKGLDANTVYHIYTNAVGGAKAADSDFTDSGVTASLDDLDKQTGDNPTYPTVVYHDVILNNTTVTNGIYNSAITYNGDKFLEAYATEETDRSNSPLPATGDSLVVPTAKFGTTDVATSDVNKWVQEGQTVDLSYANWNRDYKLEWTGVTTGADVTTAPSSGAVGGTGTLKVTAAEATVKTKLTLNLYTVTVYVVGDNGGAVNEIKLTNKGTDGEDFNFTTLASYTDTDSSTDYVTGMSAAETSGVGVGSTAVFSVPGGDYTVSAEKAAGSNLDGYLHPHTTPIPSDMSTHKDPVDVSVSTTATTDTADVVVRVAGQAMQVTDDAPDEVGDQEHNTVAGTGNNAAAYDGTVSNGEYTRTITLPYGYATDSFGITVTNTSAKAGNVIHNVTMAKTSTQLGPNNEITIADAGNAASIALDGTANMDKGDATKIAVGIAAGLPVDTYTSKLTFTFETEGTGVDGNKTATVTYNLVIKVVPARFSAVSAKDSTGAAITGMVPYGVGLVADTYTTVDHDLFDLDGTADVNALAEKTEDGGDYTYQWYYSDADQDATESWKDGVVTVSNGAKVTADGTASGTPVTGKTLSADVIKYYQGKKLYLVITAENDKNVTEAAISDPYTTGFQPVVKIAVDDAVIATEAEPTGYVVALVDKDNNEIPTKWDSALKGYVPVNNATDKNPIYLPSGDYAVKVGAYTGATTATVTLASTTQTTAFSNYTLSVAKPTVTALYYTVNAVDTKAFEGISGLGDDSFADDGAGHKVKGPAPVFTLNGDATVTITSGETGVLKNQKVDAKFAETSTGSGKAWTQDYKLTWYSKADSDLTGTTLAPTLNTAYEGTTPDLTDWGSGKQTAAAAVTNGYSAVTVTNTLFIGGRLDQNVYTITGTVVSDDNSGTVTEVKVEQVKTVDGAETATTLYTWPGSSDGNLVSDTDANGNGTLQPGETVTFKVVAGKFTITSTPHSSTVIDSVTWEPNTATLTDEGTVGSDRKGVLTKEDVAADWDTKNAYDFQIKVTGASVDLGVTDEPSDDAQTVTAKSSATKVGDRTVVRYFDHIGNLETDADGTGTTVFPLALENGGNVDMKTSLSVYHFANKTALNQSYYDTDSNWEADNSGNYVNKPIFSSASDVTEKVELAISAAGALHVDDPNDANDSARTVLTLENVLKSETVVPMGADYKATYDPDDVHAVDGAKLTLGEDAWSKDSGVFVFRFKGTSESGDAVVYYVLDLTVKQLPIVETFTQMKDTKGNAVTDAAAMPGAGYKLQAKGYDADPDSDQSLDNVNVNTSTKPDKTDAASAGLTDDDVKFAWVSVPKDSIPDNATTTQAETIRQQILNRFSVDASTGDLTTNYSGYKVLAVDSKEYEVKAPDPANGVDGDLDRDIYLITYAPNTNTVKTNATDKAISDVIRTKRTVGVHIQVDGNRVPAMPVKTDPGYVIYLVEDEKELSVQKNEDGTLTLGEGTWDTTWNNTSQGMYQAPIDMGKTYHVYAPMFLGSDAYVDTGLTLGKNSASDEVDAPYRSVAHTPNVAVKNTYDGFSSYLPDSTGDTDKEIQNALSVMVSDDKDVATYAKGYVLPKPTASAPSIPVLEGMRLKVTVDAAAETVEEKSWSDAQSYHTMSTLGWQKDGNAAVMNTTKQDDITYPAGAGDPEKYLIQSGDIVVANAAMSFSAHLEQELFTVTFEVVDDTPSDVNVPVGTTPALHNDLAQTTLKTDTAKEPDAAVITIPAKSITTGKNSVQGAEGATVTFEKVPAGALVIFAKEGNRTSVDGYHWRAEDDTADLQKGDIVQVTAPDAAPAIDKNQHNAAENNHNTIHIQFSNYAVMWADNFNPADGEHYDITEGKTGFQKKDTAKTGPFLALLEGYTTRDEDTGEGDVLTYTVRVRNSGAVDLPEFRMGVDNSNFTADLAHVRYTVGGELVKLPSGEYDTIDVGGATSNFTLSQEQFVEFEVTIPLGQSASKNDYDSIFTVYATTTDNAAISNNTYRPGYQVKPNVAFDSGNAKVLYGGKDFESKADIAPVSAWDTDAYNPAFKYTVLTETELATYLGSATRDPNAYTSDGVTADDVTTGKLPDWVVLNENTGKVTFDGSLRATDVNVQTAAGTTDWTGDHPYTADEVDNEIIFYIKAVDQETNKAYYTTYTINVEPGQLSLPDGTYWWDKDTDPDLDERSGEPVSFRHFSYTNVVNQITEDVVASTDIAGNDTNSVPNNTGLGNTDSKNKTVNVDNVHTGTWKVDKANYMLGEDVDYTFTIDYKPQDSAEKWNYKPGVVTVQITAIEPDRSLKFADEIGDATDVVGAGASYHTPADDVTMVGKDSLVPQQLPLMVETYRKNERIVYLDTEPYYDVTMEKVGGVYDVKLTVENSEGILVFALDDEGNKTTALDLEGVTLTNDTDTKTVNFRLEISDFADDPNLWVGKHHFKVTAKGYSDPDHAADATPDVEATYELILIIDPKVITKLDVKVTDGESEPDKVEGRLEGDDPNDPDQDLTTPDEKGNPPVKTTEVTWTPTDPDDQPDGKHTGVEVTVEIDPNYIYAEDDPETPDDDEDIVEHTTLTPDEPSDPDTVVVTRDEEDGDHIVHIKQTIPYLMHSDVKVGTTPSDTTGPKVDDTRRVSGVTTDDTNLGRYEIQLGGYPVGTPNGKVYDVEWSVVTDELSAVGAKLVDGDGNVVDFATMEAFDLTSNGDKRTVYLDMTAVDFPAAGTYILKLKAVGEAVKGGDKTDEEDIQSTYTITVNVANPAPGDLKYADAKAADGSDAKGPADEVTRTVRIAKNAKPETLAAHVYDVYLSSVGHMVYGVTVQPDKELPEGWVLTPSVEAYPETVGDLPLGEAARHHHVLDLTGVSTAEKGTTTVIFTAKGYSSKDLYERSKTDATVLPDVDAIYKVEVVIYTPTPPSTGGSPDPGCPNQVTFLLGVQGITNDPVMEMVAANGKVSRVPSVTTLDGYKFLGWSLKAPTGDFNEDAKRQLTEPKSLTISGNTTFYAVYQKLYDVPKPPFHEHYVIGYPNGNFGPADNIDRASVATIIARAVLPNFVEGANYGNPGGYTDVDGHWAASAIAYCSKYGVFQGYDDGSFRPSQPITRQELALVMARLTGVQGAKDMPFSDISEAGAWAMDGIYTAYANGWVNGYNDGTFKPLNPIRRDETVKMFNAYLGRGVDAEGLGSLTEYVHSGVASNNTENGTTEYMTWPDVSKDQWAYYEIIEAANDHEFKVDATVEGGYTVPEEWDKCWIDEKWRYHDDLTDGGPTTGLLAAGFRIWSK